jgi:hypothetical protein
VGALSREVTQEEAKKRIDMMAAAATVLENK